MPNVAVVDMTGTKIDEINLADSIFGIEPNAAVMHDLVVNYLANQRQGTQSALTTAGVPWLPSDFKKQGREMRSRDLANEHGIYQQLYCGCEYSLHKREEKGDNAPDPV